MRHPRATVPSWPEANPSLTGRIYVRSLYPKSKKQLGNRGESIYTLRHLHGTLTPTQRTRGQKQQRMQEREQRRESDANCKASSQASGHSTRANKANGQHRKNSRNQATEDSPGNAGSTVSLRRQFQLSIFRSSGAGLPFPVSSRSFRLSRKVAHLVLQCAVNSTASRQFRWPKRTML